ncbi:MAG: SRPBCC family protein [Devosia nanyangense]|uniref:SRPBCC family protein n=1 Tax=Devosia nanyangense TaxID=1228055 RepID=A0A933NZT9_9HYPH|nr:SRPBCC family protein [Devosia nanyangense]
MDAKQTSEQLPSPITTTDRHSDREVVVTRTFNGPARIVFDAWTKPEIIMKWWTPASFGITFISCEADVRVGGTYRFVFGHPDFDQPMAFVGRYLDVDPPKRLVWTNEESEDGSVTTVTFEEKDGKTHLILHDLYPSKAALDEAMASGGINGYPEQFDQLDKLLGIQG